MNVPNTTFDIFIGATVVKVCQERVHPARLKRCPLSELFVTPELYLQHLISMLSNDGGSIKMRSELAWWHIDGIRRNNFDGATINGLNSIGSNTNGVHTSIFE